MDWEQILTIIGIILILFFIAIVFRIINDMYYKIETIILRLDGHARAIDQINKKIIELLKERK